MGHLFGIIIYFFLGGALLNFNNVITRKDFHNLKKIMIAHYIKKSLAKEIHLLMLYYVIIKYICLKIIFVKLY